MDALRARFFGAGFLGRCAVVEVLAFSPVSLGAGGLRCGLRFRVALASKPGLAADLSGDTAREIKLAFLPFVLPA
ncbi:hypothetical protein AB0G73_23860 [Streptomyces sp. NPDC020719]|uniref:hypothetical protein n=1 Tax=Streptomyces sp. NPDC020719 TaxID=3154896 RepID=UPI0033FEF421